MKNFFKYKFNRVFFITASVAILSLLATAYYNKAHAADVLGLDYQKPSWTGWHVGASVSSYQTDISVGPFNILENDGYTGGIHVGHDRQYGLVIFGVQGNYDWVLDESGIGDVRSAWSISARGGVLVTDKLLAFARLGYGQINNGDFDDTKGIIYGGGLEYKLNKKLHLFTEVQQLAETEDTIQGLEFDTTRVLVGFSIRLNK